MSKIQDSHKQEDSNECIKEEYKFPDTILVEIVYQSSPISLYWIWTGVPHEYPFISDNEGEIRNLLRNKFVVNRLCEENGIKKLDTFEEFLLEWDEWNLDRKEISSSYFKRRWKHSIDAPKALYYLGRNAKQNSSCLEVVDSILNSKRLWYSEFHIRELCKSLFWSYSLILKYTEKIRNYESIHGIEGDFCVLELIKFSIEDQTEIQNIIVDHSEEEHFYYLLENLSFNEVKDLGLLDSSYLTREGKISSAILNNDIRLLKYLNATAEEIMDNYTGESWLDNHCTKKIKYFYNIGLNKDFDETGIFSLFNEILEKIQAGELDDNIDDIIEELSEIGEESYYILFDLCQFADLHVITLSDILGILLSENTPYYPNYIQFFTEKALEPQNSWKFHFDIGTELSAKIQGDLEMEEWRNGLNI